MALSQRTRQYTEEAKPKTGLISSVVKRLAWYANEYSSLDIGNILEGSMGGMLAGAGLTITTMMINLYTRLLLSYLTDWDVSEMVYPITTMETPMCFGPLLGMSYVFATRYKSSYSDDEAYESLKKTFKETFTNMPAVFWNAPRAFIQYPLTVAGNCVVGSAFSFFKGMMPAASISLAIGAIDMSWNELAGNPRQTNFFDNKNIMLLGSVVLASTTGLAMGFSEGLEEGVHAAEVHRLRGEPTAFQSTTRLLMETLPNTVRHYANQLKEMKTTVQKNKLRVAKKTFTKAQIADVPLAVLLPVYLLFSLEAPSAMKERQLALAFKFIMYFALPVLGVGNAISFFSAVNSVKEEEKIAQLREEHNKLT